MTTIVPIGAFPPLSGHEPQRADADTPETRPTGATALVPVSEVQPPAEDNRRSLRRSSASFLAQLIANEKNLPQTRERRRADPQVALAAYGAAAKLVRRR